MSKFMSQYGLYPWFEEHGAELVHPDDLDAFRRLLPYGKVFQCVGIEGEYLRLTYGTLQFRLKPKLFQPVAHLSRKMGESVIIRGQRSPITGIICDVLWHFNRNEPYYFILVNGKKKSKRYSSEDFVASPN